MSPAPFAACDQIIADSSDDATEARHPIFVLVATILASSLAFVDGSVVNVGLPAIRDGLHADPAGLQWVVNAYLLPLSALLLLGGAVGDRLGRRNVLVTGVLVYGAASMLCATAGTLPVLLFARGMEGMASAFILPNSLSILGATFPGNRRGRAIGAWAAAGAATGAVGPVLGGWLIDHFGWRTIFFINLPLAATAIALALLFVPKSTPSDGASKLDLLGSGLATAGLSGLTWGLTAASGAAGWTMMSVAMLVLGAVILVGFFYVEGKRGARAAMPLSLFTSRSFVALSILTFFLYGALSALFVLVPYVLIGASHYSGTAAGAALLPLPLLLVFASPAIGALVDRIGPRLPLIIGPVLVATGFGLLVFLRAGQNYWTGLFPALLLISIGMSGAAAPLTTAVLASASPGTTGAASGLNSAISRLGGTFATALLGGVLASSGSILIARFHTAAIVGAFACFIASGAIAYLFRPEVKGSQRRPPI